MANTSSANDRPYWLRQSSRPLFPDLIWSRPVTKQTAGKLLIIGGNSHSFAAVNQAYNAARSAGAGTIHLLLPDSLQKVVSSLMPGAAFAPSSPSGGFSRESLASLLEASQWADGTIIAGDLGRNSETAILVEQYIDKYSGILSLTGDALDFFTNNPSPLFTRRLSLIVPSFNQFQKMAAKVGFTPAFTSSAGLVQLIDQLHLFSQQYHIASLLNHLENAIASYQGTVSTTKVSQKNDLVTMAAKATVWWLQNPTQIIESLTSSLITK